jgi:hypothetical protein
MKKIIFTALLFAGFVAASCSAPLRLALLDFEDQTGLKSDAQLGGAIAPGALAGKGVFLLTKHLLGAESISLIDRRDFIEQIEKLQPTDSGEAKPTKPSFLHAAQALRADVVLRGSLLSFSTGKQVVNQGGYETEFSTLSLHVAVEALDAVDGSVIAMADSTASGNFRQTKEHYTVISEEDAMGLFDKALAQAVPQLEISLKNRMERESSRPKVKLTLKTSADPALIEIDGILVGSTPVENLEIYQGDHVITVGKQGYRDITKRILFEKNTAIEIPMMRTQLSAEELKEIFEKIRLNVVEVDPGIIIHTEE